MRRLETKRKTAKHDYGDGRGEREERCIGKGEHWVAI